LIKKLLQSYVPHSIRNLKILLENPGRYAVFVTNSSGPQTGFFVKKKVWKRANWRPNVRVAVESETTLPAPLAHDECICIHPETDTKGCEEERLSRRDKNVSSFYSQNYSHQPTAHSD